MKAENERVEGLKIGNLVSAITCDGSEAVDIVSELILVDDSVFFKTLKGWSKGRPIPLTEEWLLKFGFSLVSYRFFISGGHEVRSSAFMFNRFSYFIGSIYIAEVEYVHQLQNLYFALTGKELEIK